ncbi:ATPase/GTPase, AAA15 family [Thiothrix caldifontis]|uniref:ATPase/GTPase, AAA15 family n=1 Tax=Thiothrix caldifontis TaxID=525918 RepID=A0A1H3Y7J2_9GAMM|nr:ATP-binding protein [Thiothrix caldifontis]SEA07647.1 ATPase/GTPase, AAA15 family [Thiothrix caldifontis]
MLDSLHIKNFRCFEDLTIPSLGRVNLIVGKNSVGKTTLLEAIDILGNDAVISNIRKITQQRSLEKIEELFNSKTQSSIYIGNLDHTTGIEISLTNGDISVRSIEGKIEKPTTDHSKSNKAIALKINTLQELFDLFDSEPRERLNSSSIYSSFSSTKLESEEFIHSLYGFLSTDDEFNDTGLHHLILEWLRIINNKINHLYFLKKEKNIIAMIKIDGINDAIPLQSMGEGIKRLLQMLLRGFESGMFSGEYGGFWLIDEFENGLHYSIQEEVWEKLFKLAKELDIQVFATTHSEDTVKAFCKVSLADDEVDGKLISLGRSAAIADNGKILADVYDEKTLAWIVQSGMEVR